MIDTTKLKTAHDFQFILIDSTEFVSTREFYASYGYADSTLFNGRYGSSICGEKIDSSTRDAARFYIFGGVTMDGTLFNDLLAIEIDLTGGGPFLSSVVKITPSTSTIPPKRFSSSLKKVGSFIFLYGGVDELGSILSDIWRFSLLDLKWTEMQPQGNVPSPRVFAGEMN